MQAYQILLGANPFGKARLETGKWQATRISSALASVAETVGSVFAS